MAVLSPVREELVVPSRDDDETITEENALADIKKTLPAEPPSVKRMPGGMVLPENVFVRTPCRDRNVWDASMSASRVHLSVVIPVFNEAARIGKTLEELCTHVPALVPTCEIRVVDDGSDDETATIVEHFSRGDSRVVLQREPHRGKGWAVRAGLLAATGELRFMCDADLSMPVSEMPRFLAMVPTQCDIAIGSREGVGSERVGEPAYRHTMGRAFSALVKAMVLPGLDDTQCGFKLFTSHAVEAVFPMTTIAGWAFDVEVLFVARCQGQRITGGSNQVALPRSFEGISRSRSASHDSRPLDDQNQRCSGSLRES